MKKTLIFVLLIAGFIIGFVVDRQLFRPDPETIIETKTETKTEIIIIQDTVKVEKIVYREIPATLTHAEVFDKATQKFELVPSVASVDTVFMNYGRFFVDYYFPPKNYFDLAFDPFPQEITQKIIRETRFVKTQPRWYQTQKMGILIGVAATAITVYLVK